MMCFVPSFIVGMKSSTCIDMAIVVVITCYFPRISVTHRKKADFYNVFFATSFSHDGPPKSPFCSSDPSTHTERIRNRVKGTAIALPIYQSHAMASLFFNFVRRTMGCHFPSLRHPSLWGCPAFWAGCWKRNSVWWQCFLGAGSRPGCYHPRSGVRMMTRNARNIFSHGHVVEFSGWGSAAAAPPQELCVCRERWVLGNVW